ncbi:hypothetical protein AWB70_05589 [Caballeronia cordobensis]|uniref:Lipoprotein n=1 Tax=Caballeronia cordobensis TaxID=1353886 RepID=A0A158IY83_CABCO|nr:hypothetical protein [Caballeronia cordobensis]SAL61556.1 hypothetical protein AWB70_05589 [Caballeronia cordobensis]
MPTVSSRHAVVARIIVCAYAIVCGCSKPESPSSDTPARSEPSALPATTATSELQDWAKQATDATAPPAMARAASEPLATPVIHTVD